MAEIEKKVYSEREVFGDYMNEFTLLEGYLSMLEEGLETAESCIETFKKFFEKQNYKAVYSFKDRAEQKYGMTEFSNNFQQEIEQLNILVDGINKLYADYFQNKTIDSTVFLEGLKPLVAESVRIISVTQSK